MKMNIILDEYYYRWIYLLTSGARQYKLTRMTSLVDICILIYWISYITGKNSGLLQITKMIVIWKLHFMTVYWEPFPRLHIVSLSRFCVIARQMWTWWFTSKIPCYLYFFSLRFIHAWWICWMWITRIVFYVHNVASTQIRLWWMEQPLGCGKLSCNGQVLCKTNEGKMTVISLMGDE